MKNRIRFWSNLLLGLPLFFMLITVDALPGKIAIHFSTTGQADQFTTRQLWLKSLLDTFILLIIIRTVLLIILTRKTSLSDDTFTRIQLLSAGFVALFLLLFVGDALLSAPLSAEYMPFLVVIFTAVGLYFLVPTSAKIGRKDSSVTIPTKQLEALQYIQALSRIVTVRVNILAGIVMLFAQSKDRWTIGILANLLAFAALSLLAYRQLRRADP